MNLLGKSKRQQKESEKRLTVSEVSKCILERLYEYTEAGYDEADIAAGLRSGREEHRKLISACIRTCCSGDVGAKETIKELIYRICMDMFPKRNDYLKLMSFHEPAKMQGWYRLEALIFYLDKQKENQGFRLLCEKFGWNKPGGTVLEKDIEHAYKVLNPSFTENEERQILAQIMFALTV